MRPIEYRGICIETKELIFGSLVIPLSDRRMSKHYIVTYDKNNKPIIQKDENGNSIGSERARLLIIDAISSTKDNIFVSINNNPSMASNADIGLGNIRLDPPSIQKCIDGVRGGLNSSTLGYAMTFFHEYFHASPMFALESEEHVIERVNSNRIELGEDYGRRIEYGPNKTFNTIQFTSQEWYKLNYKYPIPLGPYIQF
jgi:hypothetical protein